MKIILPNGRFIEYRKSDFFKPDPQLFDRNLSQQFTSAHHPIGAGLRAYYLGRSPGNKYQLVEIDGAWLFISLRGSGEGLTLVFKSDPMTISEAESIANQHNASILAKA